MAKIAKIHVQYMYVCILNTLYTVKMQAKIKIQLI